MRFLSGQFAGRWLVAVAAVFAAAAAVSAEPLHKTAAIRRPVSLVRIGDVVLTANRETGSVSILNTDSLSIVGECPISKSLDDLIAVPHSNSLLAVDSSSHELIQIGIQKGRITAESVKVIHRVPVARYPVSVVAMPSGNLASVASRWSRRLTVVLFDGEESAPRVARTIDLPFAPGKQLALDDRHVLVADAFAGQLAVVDVRSGTIRSRRALNGHNIRGLGLGANRQRGHGTHQI
ncbi:MAG: hypothetical protein H8E37_10285, partial [Planctomycetes bacterium]|nr:hypothetical protein [Planctomycetota bacterium]